MEAQFFLGLGISTVSFFGRYAMTQMPKPIAWAGVASGAILMGAQLLNADSKPPLSSITFAILAVVCFGIAVHLYLDRSSSISQTVTPIPPPNSLDSELSAEERARQMLLAQRGALELAAREASGTPITIEFQQLTAYDLHLSHGGKEYLVNVSIADATSTWIYGETKSGKKLYVVKSAERGKPVDIRTLRPSKQSDVIRIGQRAFIELNDGKIAQIILVGALFYRAGDDRDEARYKYKIYDAGEFLIDAL